MNLKKNLKEKIKMDENILDKYSNLKIKGYPHTWYAFDKRTILGKLYLLLENEEYGDEIYHMIYNYTDKKVMTIGIGIDWLDLKDILIDELENELNNKL